MQLESSPTASRPQHGQAPARPSNKDGGLAPSPARVSVRLLDSERDIDETLPLTLAAHEESRHRGYPLDPERRRRFLRVLRRMLRADPLQLFVMRYYFGRWSTSQ